MAQRKSCIFDVPQRSGEDHNCQADPEKHEEASKVSVLAPGVKVGDAGGIFNSRKHPVLLLCSYLLSSRRGGYGGWGSIFWDWGGASTAGFQQQDSIDR